MLLRIHQEHDGIEQNFTKAKELLKFVTQVGTEVVEREWNKGYEDGQKLVAWVEMMREKVKEIAGMVGEVREFIGQIEEQN